MTRYKGHTGKWRTINRSTFAGWYTRPFCEDVVDSFTQEFAIRDHMELKHGRKQPAAATRKCVRFRLPNQTLTTKVSNARPMGAYIPTKFLQCDHCGSWFSSIAARRTHIQSRHPQKYREWQLSQLEKGDKRIKLRHQQITPTEDTTTPSL